jgi:hypothetical protein
MKVIVNIFTITISFILCIVIMGFVSTSFEGNPIIRLVLAFLILELAFPAISLACLAGLSFIPSLTLEIDADYVFRTNATFSISLIDVLAFIMSLSIIPLLFIVGIAGLKIPPTPFIDRLIKVIGTTVLFIAAYYFHMFLFRKILIRSVSKNR